MKKHPPERAAMEPRAIVPHIVRQHSASLVGHLKEPLSEGHTNMDLFLDFNHLTLCSIYDLHDLIYLYDLLNYSEFRSRVKQQK